MPVTVVVGAQFGDEAKGKISDYLAGRYRYVVRTGGGPNAGHSIHLPEGSAVLHQIACGALRTGVTAISGPGMVINPFSLENELEELETKRLLKGDVVVSDRAHVLLPLHEIEDGWEEAVRAAASPRAGLGTTRRGIGPAYSDRYSRWGMRYADLIRPDLLKSRLELLYARKAHIAGLPPISELHGQLSDLAGRLAPLVRPTEPILWGAIDRGQPILLEGAQSALLDVDFGTYPYVTSSHPTSAGALVGSGIPPAELDEVVGVAKAYATRVGAGPFPTEAEGEVAAYLQREGGERGATTGRPRQCGWLDLVLLRYASRLNGFTSLAITKVDVLAGLDEIPVCTRYRLPNGEILSGYPPSVAEDLEKATPIYEKFPSWPRFTERLKERIRREGAAALPPPLRRFLGYVARETRVPVEFVSYGPMRDETVWLGRGVPARSLPSLTAWAA